MTLGSLFDGIGGWLLAARHAGVKPLWSSEIEPFPCSVTAHHFDSLQENAEGIQRVTKRARDLSAKKSGRNAALSVRVNHFTVVGKMVNRT